MEKKEKILMRMLKQSNPNPEWMKKWTWKMTWRVNKKKMKKLNMALTVNPFTRNNKSKKSFLKRRNFERNQNGCIILSVKLTTRRELQVKK